MPLIGDVIVRVRDQANDPCPSLLQPLAPTLSASGAGTLTGNIFGILTWLNQWGETVGSVEVSITGLFNNQVSITLNEPAPTGATSGRFYYSAIAGREQQYVTLATTGSNFVGTTGQTILAATPPYKPSAFLPEADGDLVSAFEIYRWMNAGLQELGRLAGGILDQTGVAMSASALDVVIPGFWLSIDFIWHNGWLTLPARQSENWLQSVQQGTPSISTVWKNAAQQVLGVWPQPTITPPFSTLTAGMLATDTSASVTLSSPFTPPGLVLIDNEVMSFSQVGSSTTLIDMVRGYGGSVAAAHAIGATVTQATLRFLGRRMPVVILPGQSGSTLDVPAGWDTVLDDYLLSRFKQTEQNVDEAGKLMQEFITKGQALREQPDEGDDAPMPLRGKNNRQDGLYPIGGNQLRRPMPNTWVRGRQRDDQQAAQPNLRRRVPPNS